MALPKVGFTPESPQNFIVDSGVIVRDLKYDKAKGFTGTPIGATSGGTKVEIEIKKRLMDVDGAYVTPVKGLEVTESFVAKMSSKLKEFSPETIALISGGSARQATEDEAPAGYQVIEFERQVKDGDYVDSIAVYGFQRGTGKEIIVVLDNCLVTSNFGLDTKDKDEATSDLEFTAHATPEQMLAGEMPCRIFYPGDAIPSAPRDVTGVINSDGSIQLTWDAEPGVESFVTHYGDANSADPHDAKYMGYTETNSWTLAAKDVPTLAVGDKLHLWVMAYKQKGIGVDDIEKARYLHDNQHITGSAWSDEVIIAKS